MKIAPSVTKLRGAYYTPRVIARFLARWAVRSASDVVLEPSCGDGCILEEAVTALQALGASDEHLAEQLLAAELDGAEAAKAVERLSAAGVQRAENVVQVGDFFREVVAQNLASVDGRRFSAVVGNPPFIRYQDFRDEHRELAFYFMRGVGLSPNRLTNAWVPFVVAATRLMAHEGRLAMVIPAELFQVSYTAELRSFLADFFRRITVVTFRQLVFPEIQQEIVLLLGERAHEGREGIDVVELDNAEDLAIFDPDTLRERKLKPIQHSTDKWTQYYLDADEVLLLRNLASDPRIERLDSRAEVDVGVVTGQNAFFVVDAATVDKWGLHDYVVPIVSRSAQLRGLRYANTDWAKGVELGEAVSLFSVSKDQADKLPIQVMQYIAHGENKGYHTGYKCRIRKFWPMVPSVWAPDAFLLRQVHGFPKMVANHTGATSTDTVHRVRVRPGVDADLLAASFMNSLTLAFSEVTGRSYGGGVMTFEPSECESLRVPPVAEGTLEPVTLDGLLRTQGIYAVLAETDHALLERGLGLSVKDVQMLRGIWEKLRDRRIGRKVRAAGAQRDALPLAVD